MTTLTPFQMTIGGQTTLGSAGTTFESENPYTGQPWATIPNGTEADVDAAVDAARAALAGPWGRLTGFQRAALMRRVASLVAENADQLARYEVNDNGKLYREMIGQLGSITDWFVYFAGLADKIEGRQIPTPNPNYLVYTRQEPLGVVAAITPWNSPLLLLTWKLAPALAAGCTMVIKPSEHSPASTLAFAELFTQAGFPDGVVNVVSSLSPSVGAALAAHPGVDKVAFTGSTGVGRLVARAAAENLSAVTLELGGKSPQIVFPDADLRAAANGLVAGIFAATGQTCLAGSRLLVHREVHDELVSMIAERARAIRMGNPLETDTEMGPVANAAQYDKVRHYLKVAAEEGASFACGGSPGEAHAGYFVPPTVVVGARPDATIVREEVFGPVLTVLPFDDEDEAVNLANDSPFGLASGLWTTDIFRAHRVAQRLQAGTVWINCYRVVAPNVPFGGVKHSGIGRESGIDAVDAYTETKSVWVEMSGQTRDPFTLG